MRCLWLPDTLPRPTASARLFVNFARSCDPTQHQSSLAVAESYAGIGSLHSADLGGWICSGVNGNSPSAVVREVSCSWRWWSQTSKLWYGCHRPLNSHADPGSQPSASSKTTRYIAVWNLRNFESAGYNNTVQETPIGNSLLE
ncbi:hypothetical protein J6590_035266 [Homalodisca vitripennis]|nr:hypothetical protein J6590_035266 [Homalodisca vitripennis]